MELTDRERVLYARHLLLPEIGEAGQAKLSAARVSVDVAADSGAAQVALECLARAGVQHGADSARRTAPVGTRDEVETLAGRAELLEAARALRGAFAAVETIKELVGVGRAAAFPASLSLSSEDV